MEIDYKFDFENFRPICFTNFVKPSATNLTSTLPRSFRKVFLTLTAWNCFPLLPQVPTELLIWIWRNNWKSSTEFDRSNLETMSLCTRLSLPSHLEFILKTVFHFRKFGGRLGYIEILEV